MCVYGVSPKLVVVGIELAEWCFVSLLVDDTVLQLYARTGRTIDFKRRLCFTVVSPGPDESVCETFIACGGESVGMSTNSIRR